MVPEEYIDQAAIHNKDGCGVSHIKDGELVVYKTADLDEFKEYLSKLDDVEVLIHLRAASIGGVSVHNIHPFSIHDASWIMFHNGTISSFRNKTNKCEVTGCVESDTQALANIIDECEFDHINDVVPLIQHIITKTSNKLAFMSKTGEVVIMNKSLGQEEDGIWYSNDYHIKKEYNTFVETEPNKVFVYGTLKEGYGNNSLLSNAKLIGKCTTLSNYVMIGKNDAFPYMLGRPYDLGLSIKEGHYCVGEVYEISDTDTTTLKKLDLLEGVPHHYKREKTYVREVETGKVHGVYIYIKADVKDKHLEREFLAEWTKEKGEEVFRKPKAKLVEYKRADLEKLTYEELVDEVIKFNKEAYDFDMPQSMLPENKEDAILDLIWSSKVF